MPSLWPQSPLSPICSAASCSPPGHGQPGLGRPACGHRPDHRLPADHGPRYQIQGKGCRLTYCVSYQITDREMGNPHFPAFFIPAFQSFLSHCVYNHFQLMQHKEGFHGISARIQTHSKLQRLFPAAGAAAAHHAAGSPTPGLTAVIKSAASTLTTGGTIPCGKSCTASAAGKNSVSDSTTMTSP